LRDRGNRAAIGIRLAILTRQVTTYHHARFQAAASRFESVDVLSLANEGKFAEVLSRSDPIGYRIHPLYPDLAAYRAAAASGELARAVMRTLSALMPKVVAIPGWASPESYAAIGWAKKGDARVVVMSDSQRQDAVRSPWREGLKARVLSRCDAALVAGRPHADYLVALGMDASRISLGYDVVDNRHFVAPANTAREHAAETRERLGLPRSYLVASGRFVPKKNFLRLVGAYASASRGVERAADLLIAGDGGGRADLESRIRQLGLNGSIHLPGFFRYEDLPALYGLAEGFVHVPVTEQWGLVVNEAAASALPMVLSRSCGAASMLLREGVNGWLCDGSDTDDIARALIQLLTLDPARRYRMGSASAAIVADWGPERFAQGLQAAASVALHAPAVGLGLVDRALIRLLSRRPIEDVA
jgi:glycosyltransferase involved in cell wall biosynthesis